VILENEWDSNHPKTNSIYDNIGNALAKQGNSDEALVELRKACAMRESMVGKIHTLTANSCNSIDIMS
jgi:hypothetical protein